MGYKDSGKNYEAVFKSLWAYIHWNRDEKESKDSVYCLEHIYIKYYYVIKESIF